ncbi:autophagy-related protein 8c [Tanacetum coccineum]
MASVGLHLGGSPFGHPLPQGLLTELSLQPNGHNHGTWANAVIVEKAERSDIPDIDKKEYLVPADLTVGQTKHTDTLKTSVKSQKQ